MINQQHEPPLVDHAAAPLCPVCRAMAAKTEAALRNRMHNIATRPDVDFHPCPRCGSLAWVLATSEIQPEPEQGWLRTVLWTAGGVAVIVFLIIVLLWS